MTARTCQKCAKTLPKYASQEICTTCKSVDCLDCGKTFLPRGFEFRSRCSKCYAKFVRMGEVNLAQSPDTLDRPDRPTVATNFKKGLRY